MIERKRCKRKSTLHLENGGYQSGSMHPCRTCFSRQPMHPAAFPLFPLHVGAHTVSGSHSPACPRISLSFDVAAALEAGGGKGMPQCGGCTLAPRPGQIAADALAVQRGPLAALYSHERNQVSGLALPRSLRRNSQVMRDGNFPARALGLGVCTTILVQSRRSKFGGRWAHKTLASSNQSAPLRRSKCAAHCIWRTVEVANCLRAACTNSPKGRPLREFVLTAPTPRKVGLPHKCRWACASGNGGLQWGTDLKAIFMRPLSAAFTAACLFQPLFRRPEQELGPGNSGRMTWRLAVQSGSSARVDSVPHAVQIGQWAASSAKHPRLSGRAGVCHLASPYCGIPLPYLGPHGCSHKLKIMGHAGKII